MQIPVEVKPAVWGAIGGATAMAIVGSPGRWVTAGTAEESAVRRSSATMVSAMAPVCVDRFQRTRDAPAELVELNRIDSWQQAAFIEKGRWATAPGSQSPDSQVARACVEILAEN